MSRRLAWIVPVLLLGLPLLVAVVQEDAGTAGPSALSRGSSGWLAARAYLEERDIASEILDRPIGDLVDEGLLDPAGSEEVLVTTFPWAAGFEIDRAQDLARFVDAGGVLLVGYSGGERLTTEDSLFTMLGIEPRVVRDELPYAPLAWWRAVRETWELVPALGSSARAAPVENAVVRLPAFVPIAPPDALILANGRRVGGGEEIPAAFAFAHGRGLVVVVPAEVFANGRLRSPGNLALLETLGGWLDRVWLFDEFSHGLISPAAVAQAADPPLAWDLFLLHLAILYAIAVFVLARRFGPAWAERKERVGGSAGMLQGLGALHHRLGHHAAAGRLLLERSGKFDTRMEITPDLERQALGVDDGPALVALARALAERRGVSLDAPAGTER